MRQLRKSPSGHNREPAFTLIELLVVIAVIAVLAAMLLPISAAVNKARMLSRSRGDIEQLAIAIDNYYAKHGQYPPSNPDNPALNQLYFELVGTKLDSNGVFTTLDGSAKIRAVDIPVAFGPKVTGFINSTRGIDGDEASRAGNFLDDLKPAQVRELSNRPDPNDVIRILVGLPWQTLPNPPFNVDPIPTERGANPWRYNSSNPANNPRSYDLWIDLTIGGKVYRVSNWGKPVRVTER